MYKYKKQLQQKSQKNMMSANIVYNTNKTQIINNTSETKNIPDIIPNNIPDIIKINKITINNIIETNNDFYNETRFIYTKKENTIYDIYVINLKHRVDRRNNILKQFEEYDKINIIFMEAFSDINGWVGCAKSHLYLVNYAQKNNLPYIFVIEDDFLFNSEINKSEFYNI